MSNFPSDWGLYRLDYCMEAIIDYRGKTPKKSEEGIPLLSAKVIKGGKILEEIFEYLPVDDYKAWMRRGMPKPGDVIMTTEGPLGEIAQLDSRKYALGQRIVTLRGKEGFLNNDYLKYIMQSTFVQQQLYARATGTTVLGIKQSELRLIELPIPPFDEQCVIAEILSSLDDKIELNRRMNETLEETARAIFKSWFVDFHPVHAKARGDIPIGMDEKTAALFPDSFEESELGLIPRGWYVETLGSLIELAYGKPLKAESRKGGDIPVYGSNGIIGWHDKKLIDGPGIVVGRKGNPGTVNWISNAFFPIDTTFYVVLINSNVPLEFLYFALELQNLPSLSADSAVPGLNRNIAYMNRVIIPCEPIANHFMKLIQPMLRLMAQNDDQSRTLEDTRDALLPKLVSGEIRVGEIINGT